MAQITLDLSGISGLVEKYQGDINTSAPTPNLRYAGKEGQMADGIYNPFKKHGYLSPANRSFIDLSSPSLADINSIQYDATDDIIYLSQDNHQILSMSLGLSDTSASLYRSITSGYSITDMLIYEIYGEKVLIYSLDTNSSSGGYIGFSSITGTGVPVYATLLPSTTITSATMVYAAGSTTSGGNGRALVQTFHNDYPITGTQVTGAMARLQRTSGTGVGITLRLSIRGFADINDAPYTNRGSWVTATSYAVNDVVTVLGEVLVCYLAHTSGASTQPPSGADYLLYWQKFSAPTTTDLAYGDFTLSDITDGVGAASTWEGFEEVKVNFNTEITLSDNATYCLVLSEVGSNMTASDSVSWISTNNAGTTMTNKSFSKYINTLNTWITTGNLSNTAQRRTAEFAIYLNNSEEWSSSLANGAFRADTGLHQFMHLSDNGLVYFFTGNKVHTIDGSLTGGPSGRVVENVLQFPVYTTVTSVAETRSRMYIGVQTSDISGLNDTRNYTAKKVGVYIWNKQSQIVGGSDFFLCPGAKEIKSLFASSSGDVMAITIGNSGFTELRAISGNQFAVIQTLEIDAYPKDNRSISQIENLSVWLGVNGTFYAYGSPYLGAASALYKIGDMLNESESALVTGPIFIGNEYTYGYPQTSVLYGWSDSTTGTANTAASYSNSNIDGYLDITGYTHSGQTFTGNGEVLSTARFYIDNFGTLTGSVYAELFATTAGVPTGSPLVTSDLIDLSTIGTGSYATQDFTFSTPYILENGITYLIGLRADPDPVAAGLRVGRDSSSPTGTGSAYEYFVSWDVKTYDFAFVVYTTTPARLQKWYPYGENTISSITQNSATGNIYTKVELLPAMSIIRRITIYCSPVSTTTGATIATLKFYRNQQTTPFSTKLVTDTEAARGYLSYEFNQPNSNSFQVEIEYPNSTITGTTEFQPSLAILDVEPTKTHTPDKG